MFERYLKQDEPCDLQVTLLEDPHFALLGPKEVPPRGTGQPPQLLTKAQNKSTFTSHHLHSTFAI